MKIRLKKILCPIDFSKNAAYATHYALAFAEAYRSELILLEVDEPYVPSAPIDYPGINGVDSVGVPQDVPKAEDSLERLAADLHKTHKSIAITPLRATGNPFVEIVRTAREQEVDLIVMGTHGRTGLAHMLIGSTAERVVRMAPCPVLTVKHPEHEFVMP